ncbi:hypothetical protein Cfor_11488 [Coptotermes formosanus]|uniref:Uncharacterized protein n=1 Tax=Coptotermes formosanus TaxID=36987 RepID=A0A6L2P7J7_COPFO|nr:hypothetical protein Cfor_11488 [Coptotermes formosanus]
MGSKQKTCNPRIVLIVMVVAVGSGVTSSICDNGQCSCTPPYRDITTVGCRCNTTNTGFKLTASDFGRQFRKVRDFYVSDCDGGITFTMNAFKDLEGLENLYLENIVKVEFDSGVFQKLMRLSLRNIREIDFGERAFMGARDLHNIEIYRATVPRLRSHSLFDIRGLQTLELSEVTLHRVEKDAVNVDVRLPESYIRINNCTVGSIESNGIVLQARNFSIINSAFGEMSSNAININSSELVLIRDSDFRSGLPKNAINVAASVLNIRSNTFKLLPTGIFMGNIEYENYRKLIFANNTVYNIEHEGSFDSISGLIQKADIKGNRFPCVCFVGGFHQISPDFSQNNFCTASKCNVTLSYFSALVEERKFCTSNTSEDPDEYEICANVASSAPHSPRGRAPSYFRTTQTPSTITTTTTTTTTDDPRNSSGRIQFVSVIMFFTSFAVIFKL